MSKEFQFAPNDQQIKIINTLVAKLVKNKSINKDVLKKIIDEVIQENKIKFKEFGQPVRMCLICSSKGPSITDIIGSIGLDETIIRLKKYINN